MAEYSGNKWPKKHDFQIKPQAEPKQTQKFWKEIITRRKHLEQEGSVVKRRYPDLKIGMATVWQ